LEITALEPASVNMTVGATTDFTVRINAARVNDTLIAITSSDSAVFEVPATTIVAAGQTSAIFQAHALVRGDAVLTASANDTSRQSSVHVSPQPPAVVSLVPSPLPLQEGATGRLTVTINAAQERETVL